MASAFDGCTEPEGPLHSRDGRHEIPIKSRLIIVRQRTPKLPPRRGMANLKAHFRRYAEHFFIRCQTLRELSNRALAQRHHAVELRGLADLL